MVKLGSHTKFFFATYFFKKYFSVITFLFIFTLGEYVNTVYYIKFCNHYSHFETPFFVDLFDVVLSIDKKLSGGRGDPAYALLYKVGKGYDKLWAN